MGEVWSRKTDDGAKPSSSRLVVHKVPRGAESASFQHHHKSRGEREILRYLIPFSISTIAVYISFMADILVPSQSRTEKVHQTSHLDVLIANY